jgi:type I restriction enzyme S subunit
MENDWPSMPLGDVYDFSSGLSKPRSEFGYGHSFLTFKDVLDNFFIPSALRALVNSSAKEQNACSIRRGDVFLTRTSETQHELGMSCVALKDYEAATFNGFTKRLRPRTGTIVVPEYAAYFFRSPIFRRDVTAMSSMSTRASLNNEMLCRLNIIVPPVDVQTAIGRILKSLDDKIELNRKMNENIEATARAIFKSWFIDFDPVRAKSAGRKPEGMDSATAALFPASFEDSELGKVPKGWRKTTWGNLVTLEYGKSLRSYENCTGPFPVFGTNGQIGFHTEPLCKHPGIIIGRKGAYRGVHFCDTPFFAIDTAFYVEPTDDTELRWAYYSLLNEDINSMDSGSAIPSTSREEFYQLTVEAPPTNVQRRFVSLLNPAWSRKEANERESRTLAAIRDALLPKLISGEILANSHSDQRKGELRNAESH